MGLREYLERRRINAQQKGFYKRLKEKEKLERLRQRREDVEAEADIVRKTEKAKAAIKRARKEIFAASKTGRVLSGIGRVLDPPARISGRGAKFIGKGIVKDVTGQIKRVKSFRKVTSYKPVRKKGKTLYRKQTRYVPSDFATTTPPSAKIPQRTMKAGPKHLGFGIMSEEPQEKKRKSIGFGF